MVWQKLVANHFNDQTPPTKSSGGVTESLQATGPTTPVTEATRDVTLHAMTEHGSHAEVSGNLKEETVLKPVAVDTQVLAVPQVPDTSPEVLSTSTEVLDTLGKETLPKSVAAETEVPDPPLYPSPSVPPTPSRSIPTPVPPKPEPVPDLEPEPEPDPPEPPSALIMLPSTRGRNFTAEEMTNGKFYCAEWTVDRRHKSRLEQKDRPMDNLVAPGHNLRSFTVTFWVKAKKPCHLGGHDTHWYDGCGLVTAVSGSTPSAYWGPRGRMRRGIRSRNDWGVTMGKKGQIMFGVGHRIAYDNPSVAWKAIHRFNKQGTVAFDGKDYSLRTRTRCAAVFQFALAQCDPMVHAVSAVSLCLSANQRCRWALASHSSSTECNQRRPSSLYRRCPACVWGWSYLYGGTREQGQ